MSKKKEFQDSLSVNTELTPVRDLQSEINNQKITRIQDLANVEDRTIQYFNIYKEHIAGYCRTPDNDIKVLYNRLGVLDDLTRQYRQYSETPISDAIEYFMSEILAEELEEGPAFFSSINDLTGTSCPIEFFTTISKALGYDPSSWFSPFDFSAVGLIEFGKKVELVYSFNDIKSYSEARNQKSLTENEVWETIKTAASLAKCVPYIYCDL